MFAELKRYKDEHGDCDVPDRWSENLQLARTGTLSAERKARLDELGFVWSAARSARSTSTDEPGVIQS